MWELFGLVRRQWRAGMAGRTGLDFNPAIAVMQAKGWDVALGVELLAVIEGEVLRQDELSREQSGQS